jgi:3-methyladenine DNA glycosylase/8-oxoguanine DNA glycosylase
MATDYQRARRFLMRKDPVLATVIRQVGPCELPNIPYQPPFMALAEAIASQQLSVKAADTIFGRFCALFGPDNIPDPQRLLQLQDDVIRGAGFSRSKVVFLRDLAAHVAEQRLELDRLHEFDDERVLERLTAVKGIGQWTAEIYLMFRLQRPDVFPADDLGLVKAAQNVYGLRQRPTRKKLLKMAEAWRPYRSVAAWYLWRSLALTATSAKPSKRRLNGSRSRRPRPE